MVFTLFEQLPFFVLEIHHLKFLKSKLVHHRYTHLVQTLICVRRTGEMRSYLTCTIHQRGSRNKQTYEQIEPEHCTTPVAVEISLHSSDIRRGTRR
jgi:hypothetical protein